jgi:demethylmenaquinone methyltransferase/2-methoxy-6-polyprenyl-1,4-benzoquinol methylase
MAFGLRNVTRKEQALSDMFRVLRPGGRALVLEFSHPTLKALKPVYDLYSFGVLPLLGKLVTNDAASYRYLAESIRVHPDQETLRAMMESAGFERCEYFNMTAGVVALHLGVRL